MTSFSVQSPAILRRQLLAAGGAGLVGFVGGRSVQDKLGDIINVKDAGVVVDGVTNDTAALDAVTYRDPGDHRYVVMPKGTYAVTKFRSRNVTILAEEGAELQFTLNDTPVFGQINQNSTIEGLTFRSLEADLDQQRCDCTNATNVLLKKCRFIGFRDVTGATDAWGLYMSGASNIYLQQCGFDANTQADIAIVDDNKNITVNACYGIGSTLHINLEPNGSLNVNENVRLLNMDASLVSLLENGTGGTANQGVTVENLTIGSLVYDGAEATLVNCKVGGYQSQTQPYFGNLKLVNSLGLSPNLLDDPYMMNNGFSQAGAQTDGNYWYMRLRSGAIGADQLDPLTEDGIRFIRFNPTNANGSILLGLTNPINVTAGEVYVVALTGRRHTGTSGAHFRHILGPVATDCRVFRQSNVGVNVWSTELLFIPVTATTTLDLNPGLWFSSTESVDIARISLHKVLNAGRNAQQLIDNVHRDLTGRRTLYVSSNPVFSSADMRGVVEGDQAVVGAVTSTWDGAAWV